MTITNGFERLDWGKYSKNAESKQVMGREKIEFKTKLRRESK